MTEREKASRERQRRYSGYWDYRDPRSPQEYLHNNYRRRTRWLRKLIVTIQRVAAVCVFFFILALLIGWAL